VDSAVIRLDWKPNVPDSQAFTDFVHRAFSSRRKKLVNSLASVFPGKPRDAFAATLQAEGISTDARAETLSVDQFFRVYNRIRET
jgi:16S rRNA A1518/A1519 N6-dimethyltransferase RsmA/KsgA/DIM1 with predicted DNA glycosylase/AP lyase activity